MEAGLWRGFAIRDGNLITGQQSYSGAETAELVFTIGSRVAMVLSTAPMPLRLLATITIEVFLMTYVLMPRLTKALAGLREREDRLFSNALQRTAKTKAQA